MTNSALRVVLALTCWLACFTSAFAAAPDVTWVAGFASGQHFSSVGSLCSAYAAFASSGGYSFSCSGSNESSGGYSYTFTYCQPGGGQCGQPAAGTGVASKAMWCTAANKGPDTSKPLAQQCPDPEPDKCKAGTSGSMNITTGYATGSSPGSGMAIKIIPDGGLSKSRYSVGGCTVQPTTANSCSVSQTPSANGYYAVTCSVSTQTTGAKSDPGPPGTDPMAGGAPGDPNDTSFEPKDPVPSPPGSCPANSVPGGQDSSGMTICIGKTPSTPSTPAQTTSTSKPPVVTPNADGGSTTTQQTSSTNPDGSITTVVKVTTVKGDGSVETTVSSSTKKPDGTTGGKDAATEKDDKADLCKQHAELNICKNSQVQGQCALVTCTGDAIQCATLRAAATIQCKQQQDDDALKALPSYGLGASVLSGNDPLAASLPTTKNASQINVASTLDSSGFLGGGSCFADKTLTVQGRSFVIPFSSACQYLVAFRYALMTIAALVAFRILSGAIIRE